MRMPSGYTIELADLAIMSDAEVLEAARLPQNLARERVPEDPPAPLDVIARQLRAMPPGQWRAIFLARNRDGKLAGYGVAARNLEDKDNAHIRWSDVAVAPDHRRNGLGREQYRKIVASRAGKGEEAILQRT